MIVTERRVYKMIEKRVYGNFKQSEKAEKAINKALSALEEAIEELEHTEFNQRTTLIEMSENRLEELKQK